VVEYYLRLLSRPYDQLDMEPEHPNLNEEFTTLILSTEMVDSNQDFIHPIWITPSDHDIYEKINFIRPLFYPPHTYATISVDAGPSIHPTDHPSRQTINIATT